MMPPPPGMPMMFPPSMMFPPGMMPPMPFAPPPVVANATSSPDPALDPIAIQQQQASYQDYVKGLQQKFQQNHGQSKSSGEPATSTEHRIASAADLEAIVLPSESAYRECGSRSDGDSDRNRCREHSDGDNGVVIEAEILSAKTLVEKNEDALDNKRVNVELKRPELVSGNDDSPRQATPPNPRDPAGDVHEEWRNDVIAAKSGRSDGDTDLHVDTSRFATGEDKKLPNGQGQSRLSPYREPDAAPGASASSPPAHRDDDVPSRGAAVIGRDGSLNLDKRASRHELRSEHHRATGRESSSPGRHVYGESRNRDRGERGQAEDRHIGERPVDRDNVRSRSGRAPYCASGTESTGHSRDGRPDNEQARDVRNDRRSPARSYYDRHRGERSRYEVHPDRSPGKVRPRQDRGTRRSEDSPHSWDRDMYIDVERGSRFKRGRENCHDSRDPGKAYDDGQNRGKSPKKRARMTSPGPGYGIGASSIVPMADDRGDGRREEKFRDNRNYDPRDGRRDNRYGIGSGMGALAESCLENRPGHRGDGADWDREMNPGADRDWHARGDRDGSRGTGRGSYRGEDRDRHGGSNRGRDDSLHRRGGEGIRDVNFLDLGHDPKNDHGHGEVRRDHAHAGGNAGADSSVGGVRDCSGARNRAARLSGISNGGANGRDARSGRTADNVNDGDINVSRSKVEAGNGEGRRAHGRASVLSRLGERRSVLDRLGR
jgi:hypothetical protein